MKLILNDVRPIHPHGVGGPTSVGIESGRIAWVGDPPEGVSDWPIANGGGGYASPGFVDIHVHGGGGHDFMDGTEEAYLGAAVAHARHGTTSMVPTTLTGTRDELLRTFQTFDRVKSVVGCGSKLLGLHLEGPYVSKAQLGAQDPRYAREPDPAEYMGILGSSRHIVRWTAAPELPGALEFGGVLKDRGILASIGHSDATEDGVAEALTRGYTHVTHLYSCMSTVKRVKGYRHAGVLEAAYLHDGLTVEIIADGRHLPPSLLRLVHKLKGPDRTALVTDAMRAAGTDAKESVLGSLEGGQPVFVEDGVAKLPGGEAFAGSVATADVLVRNMVFLAGVPLHEAVAMMTLTPARILGLDGAIGRLAPGMAADIVLLDDSLGVTGVIIDGRVIHWH